VPGRAPCRRACRGPAAPALNLATRQFIAKENRPCHRSSKNGKPCT
jgi:hypothetical protein